MIKKELVVGVSGASGVLYATRLLLALRGKAFVNLVVSDVATSILQQEVDWNIKKETFTDYCKKMGDGSTLELDYQLHQPKNFYATIASGSYPTDGMVVVPCSMKTLSGIAHGSSSNLMERAADVTLKERRKLILVTRETPLSRIHLKNMLVADEAGAMILPATPGFYNGESTPEQMVDFVVGRILNQFAIEHHLFKPWGTK